MTEMIVCTNIDFVTVDRDYLHLAKMRMAPLSMLNDKDEIVDISESPETIRGTRIRHSDGRDICIGVSRQASDILGFSYEVFEEQENRNKELNISLDKLRLATLWTRIKWVFTGIK